MTRALFVMLAAAPAALWAAADASADRAAPMPRAERLVDVIDALHGGKDREIFVEGPAVDAAGNVLFSDEAHRPESRILKWDPAKRELTVWREKAGRANGMTFDRQGRLIACEGSRAPGGNRRVVRYETDGSLTVLADKHAGKKLNSPNDAVVDGQDRVWFTDPRYVGDRSDMEQESEAVYRIDHPGTDKSAVVRVLGKGEVLRPNGIAVSPDGSTLYVADSPADRGARRLLLAYRIGADGSLSGRRVLHDFGENRGVDGMRLDRSGRIYGTAGSGKTSGIYVFDPKRPDNDTLVQVIPLPETPGNCGWGGPDGRTLYVAATRSLYALRLGTPGFGVFPAKWPAEKP